MTGKPEQIQKTELQAFEERVRLMTDKGTLLPYPVALFLAGISDTRLRQLVATGRLETAIIDQRPYILLRSLVAYRRQALRRLASRKRDALLIPRKFVFRNSFQIREQQISHGCHPDNDQSRKG